MHIRTTILKIVTGLLDLFILFFSVIVGSGLAELSHEAGTKGLNLTDQLQLVMGIGLALACVTIWGITYYLYRIFHMLDQHTFFTKPAVRLVRHMRYLFMLTTFVLLAVLPFFYHMADRADAPGVLVIVCGVIAIPLAIAAFIAAMEKILSQAIALQAENALTI